MTATTTLRSEHNHILAMAACLRAACAAAEAGGLFDAGTFQKGIDFIRHYADAWHHAKEEEYLFPALQSLGMPREEGPLAVMLHEHDLGRTYACRMAEHLGAATGGDGAARAMVVQYTLAYADLITRHIQKENGILFNMADRMLPPEEHARLEQVYPSAVPAGANPETGSLYEGVVAALCRQWNVDARQAAAIGSTFRCG